MMRNFQFLRDNPEHAAVMASPEYHKSAIMENFPMLTTMWIDCQSRFSYYGVLLLDMLYLTDKEPIPGKVGFGVMFLPEASALQLSDSNPGLIRMMADNNPQERIVFFVMHPRGQSFYHMGSLVPLQVIHDAFQHQFQEAQVVQENMISEWMRILDIARKEQARYVADLFIKAGNGEYDIIDSDLMAIGVEKQKSFKTLRGYMLKIDNWEALCQFVYERLTNRAMPSCSLSGRGFRSKWFGKQVSTAIREVFNG